MKLKQLWDARISINKLLQADLEAALSWRLKPLAIQVNDLQNVFSNLVRKYGHQNDQGWQVSKENEETLFEELNTLLDEEISIEIKSIRLDELNGLRLSTIDLINLEWLIIENSEPSK